MASSSSSSSSSSELRKRGEGGKNNKYDDEVLVVPDDKISELPDAILCQILSSFPTRYVVRTSILSRRWRYVWTSIPCIDLARNGWFTKLCTTAGAHRVYRPNVDGMVLHLNELHYLRKFKLHCLIGKDSYNWSRVNEWISNVIMRHGLEELDLDICQPIELPPSIFTCKKLVILKLIVTCCKIGITRLNVPESLDLPCMKSIHVNRVQLCNNDSLKNLLNGCPVLEELNFACEYDYNVTTLFVKSSSLKLLILDLIDIARNKAELEVVVEAPNLERLDIGSVVTEKIVVIDLSSVVEVKLGLRLSLHHYGPGSSVGANVYGNRLVQLLGKMSNTKYMKICWETMKSLGNARLDTLPTFHNLIDLRVLDNDESSWHMLPFILERSPNLINFHYSSAGYRQFVMPQCVMLHLEKFHLAAFIQGLTDHEMRMLKYFLNNAPVLKEISIFSSVDEDLKMLEGLSMLPSRSTACRIIFTSVCTRITINV